MQVNKEADFVLKGRKVLHPQVQTDELELYYDVKGKKNGDVHKDKLLDMSGQGKDGELSGFDYDGELSGYDGGNGLVFDGIDATLTVPKLSNINSNNFTYQLNNNILAFTGDAVKTVKNGNVEVSGRNLLPHFTSNRWNISATIIDDYHIESTPNYDFLAIIALELESHTEYTITFNTENGRYYFYDYPDGEIGRIIHQSYYSNTDSVVETFTTGEETSILLWIDNYSRVLETTRKIWDIKLEKGTEATDWTPTPEDLLEATELKGNILGDMEGIMDASPRDRQSGKEVFTEHADDSHVHVEVDGQSYQHGDPSPDYPVEIESLNDFDVVSSVEKLSEGQLQEYDYGVEYENVDKINLSLSEPLRSVGDVKDRLFRDGDGLWKIERNVGEIELKGTGRWATDSYRDKGYNYAYFKPPNFKTMGEVRSNILPRGGVTDNTRETVGGTSVIIFNLRDSRTGVLSSDSGSQRANKIRDYLFSIEGAMVSCELATPTIETLDRELQDKLNTLKSFKGSNYIYTVLSDSPHKEQLKPTLHATFNSKDYLKETRTLTNLLIWARELSDEELIHHNKLFLNRFNLPSDRVVGEPIEQTLSLLHGGMVGHSLEQNYTIDI